MRLKGEAMKSYINKRGVRFTEKGSGVEIVFTTGEKRFVLATMPAEKDDEGQARIILAAGKPIAYRDGLTGGGCR
jgi:hypothetical protein